jgi:protein-ribulosamine 3-kinase
LNWQDIESGISKATGSPFVVDDEGHLGGGCINTAMKISGSGEAYFVKFNDASRLDMFEAEAAGLHDLAEARAVRVPLPICTGITGNQAYIVIEYLAIGGGGGSNVMSRFGEQFARMHQHGADRFGWHRENTIGSTPQINDWEDDWVTFYQKHRLDFQLDLASQRGIGSGFIRKGRRLQENLSAFFTGYTPQPSILHGDLWSGNYGICNGEAVIFDPAVYFGDREADLAMTELFGAFGRDFYASYNAEWPVDAGYRVRKTLYNLYHIINHYNIFGGGYGAQAESMLDRLLAETR